MSTAEKSKTIRQKQEISDSEKERIIDAAFKKKAEEAARLLERIPIPEHFFKSRE